MVKTKGAKNKEPREAGTPYDLKQTAKEEAVEAERKRSQPTLLQLFGKKDSAITPVPQASGSSSTASSVAISSEDPVRKLFVVHFPVSGKLPSVTVISNGQWGPTQRASPDLWSFQPYQRNGEGDEDWRRRCIPLREGATWEITRGNSKVTIRIAKRISSDSKTPMIRATDSSFNRDFPPVTAVSDTPRGLKDAWTEQGKIFTGTGVSFMCFDRMDLGDYFRSVTAGFYNFERAPPSISLNSVPGSSRQLRELRSKFSNAINTAIEETRQGRDPGVCFKLGASHPDFLSKFGPSMVEVCSEQGLAIGDSKLTASLKKGYNSGNKVAKRTILSAFLDCNSTQETMRVFGCTKWAVRQAKLFSLLGSNLFRVYGPRITRRFLPSTAEHLQSWVIDPKNVVQVAHSNTGSLTLLRRMNRLRSYLAYWRSCVRAGVKPAGKSSFHKYFSVKTFSDMKTSACACVKCVQTGDESFDELEDIVRNYAVAADRNSLLCDLRLMQKFYREDFKRLVRENLNRDDNVCELRCCLKQALSLPGTPHTLVCDKEHVDSEPILSNIWALFADIGESVEQNVHDVAELAEVHKDLERLISQVKIYVGHLVRKAKCDLSNAAVVARLQVNPKP